MSERVTVEQLLNIFTYNENIRGIKERFRNMKIVSRKEMRLCVEQGVEFKGTNKVDYSTRPTVWGEWRQYGPYADSKPLERCFCVFSYSYSWPIIVFSELTNKWYANQEKASPTTTRHMTECKPTNATLNMVSRSAMLEIVANGTAGAVRQIVKAA